MSEARTRMSQEGKEKGGVDEELLIGLTRKEISKDPGYGNSYEDMWWVVCIPLFY